MRGGFPAWGFPVGKAGCRRALDAGILVVLAAGIFFTWQRFAPVVVADGWSYRVHDEGVARVSALAPGEGGADADLYYSEERSDRQGRIVHRAADGSRHAALTGLSKPDGLLAWRGGIVISQEQGEFPVYWLHGGKTTPLFTGRNVEGLSTDGYYLYAIEDVKENGRLLRYDPANGDLAVLRSGLVEGEGIAVCPDGG
ncbi:MAG: hypothetical protein LBI59_01125, partial [Candidatus Accumulibacter sp.]|nr:hypothetical protein [Accumulibacter sp.]